MNPREAWLTEVHNLYDRWRRGERTYDLDASIRETIEHCRKLRCSWQEIGDAMGTSRQYANRRYGTEAMRGTRGQTVVSGLFDSTPTHSTESETA